MPPDPAPRSAKPRSALPLPRIDVVQRGRRAPARLPPRAPDPAPRSAKPRSALPLPRIDVVQRGRRAPALAALAARLARHARRILRGLGLDGAELSVVLVADREMRTLNRRWRGRDRPTDVLSFAQREGRGGAPDGLLGDVVLSVDTARRQARHRGEAPGRD